MTRVTCGLLLALLAFAAHAWPTLPAPPGARIEAIGEQVRLNGVPMQLFRVLAAQPAALLLDHYRAALGPRHAFERLPDRLILAQERDGYFVTVSVRALHPQLTEALVSIAAPAGAASFRTSPLGIVWPGRSMVVSDMESLDGGRRARQVVVVNDLAVAANVQAMMPWFIARGLHPDGPPLRQEPHALVQLYRGNQGEAQLIIHRDAGNTYVILTLIDLPWDR
jgi:hypothetical protein